MKGMNYSSLTATIRRIHQATMKSKSTGVSIEDILGRDIELRQSLKSKRLEDESRRKFLLSAGAIGLGAGLGLGGRQVSANNGQGNDSDTKIAIIGAGPGGMRTAHRLNQYGIPSRLYEARNRPGGRMYSNRDFFSGGRIVEWGGELISTEHTALRNLVHQLNLELVDQNKVSPGEEEVYLIDGQLWNEHDLMDEWVGGLYQSLKDALMAAPWQPTWDYHTPAHEDLDNMSAQDWLTEIGYNSSHWVHKLMMTDLVSEYGILEENSALNLIYIMAYNNRGSGGLPLAGTDERFTVVGGNDQVITRMEAELSSDVEYERKLEAIVGNFGGPYTLVFDTGDDEICDLLVLAIPYGLIREIDIDSRIRAGFTPQKRDSIDKMVQSDNGKVQMEFTDQHWDMTLQINDREVKSNGRAYSNPDEFISTWESGPGEDISTKVLVDYTGGKQSRKLRGQDYNGVAHPADVNLVLNQWENIWPGISAKYTGKALVSNWWDHPLTRGAFVSPVVGTMTDWWGAQWETQGNIFFAGEACDVEYWSYMNGAILSGERVATEIHQL